MGKTSKYYAVRVGRTTGIFKSWGECEAQIKKYSGAVFKSFACHSEALDYLDGKKQTASFSSRSSRGRVTKPHRHIRHNSVRSSSENSIRSSSENIPVVFSDGCCLNNGSGSARAGIGVYWSNDSPYNVSRRLDGPQTNQRAELVSACRAIEAAINQGFSSVEVKTDSMYTIRVTTEWIDNWRRNGWHTVNGKSVKNKADIEELDRLCKAINVKHTLRLTQGFLATKQQIVWPRLEQIYDRFMKEKRMSL